ncbi:DUF5787 family protein [Haloarculaceae archaeon H-GB1-1]|nr:DUF5787 family protein [Haloarculaceae archaeon H-GB1-1]
MREFDFELALCAHLEAERPDWLHARQLGASVEGRRIIDIACIEPGPEFETRTRLSPDRLPLLAVESDVGTGRACYWKDAFDCHPDSARAAMQRAVEAGFFERERRGGRTYVRQTTRYPDWFGRIVGVENKPDLGRPGDLQTQLRTDVALGLFDEVVLATESYVTGAHLNRIPDAVGVWRFDPDDGEREVVREPTPLAPDDAGVEVLERGAARTDVAIATAAQKVRARRRLAERAYGKGWRTYAFPSCERASAGECAGAEGLPYCAWKDRFVDAASECGDDCPGHDPAAPSTFDVEVERARRTPWEPEASGFAREQSGLDRFR